MYKELERYKNGATVGLGALLHEFILHVNKPWWRRKKSHKRFTNEYINILNVFHLTKPEIEESNEVTCPVCNGKGYLISSYEGETKRTECIRCNGTGKIPK